MFDDENVDESGEHKPAGLLQLEQHIDEVDELEHLQGRGVATSVDIHSPELAVKGKPQAVIVEGFHYVLVYALLQC